MTRKILIAPSILSADFASLGDEIKAVEKAGADWAHIDVMDGLFVPNITIGPLVVKAVRPLSKLFFDVHLMIHDPGRYVDEFAKAGSDLITFHIEAAPDPFGVISKIKASGKKVGVSIKPATPVSALYKVLGLVDLVLVMSVEPGFGGQSFMPGTMEKVKELKRSFKGFIQVDGGINGETSKQAMSAGANVLVAGTAVFGEKSYRAAIKKLRN